MKNYIMRPLSDNVDEMFIGPFGSSLKNDCFVKKDSGYCMVYEQKHAIQKTMDVETRYVTEEKYNELKRFNICGGDIIVSCRGTIGETFIVPDDAPLGIMHPSIMKIRLKKDVYDKSYFNLLLQKWLRKHETGANGSGVKMAISAKKLGAELFPVPPIEEQRKISDIILKVHQIINERTQQLQKLDELVKARFVEMFGDPLSNNKGWQKVLITEVCHAILGGGTPSKSHPEYFTGSIPWVSPKDMKSLVINDSIDHITEEAIAHSTTNLVPANSVLMVIRSGILKHTLPVAVNSLPVTVNQDMKAFVPNETVKTVFLMRFFKAIENDVLAGVRGVTADNIDFKAFQKRTIIVPPLALQEQFAAFVEQADKSKVTVQKALDEAQLLFDSLMQKYFG